MTAQKIPARLRRIELDCLVVIVESFCKLVHLVPGIAANFIRLGVLRLSFDHQAEISDCLVVFLLASPDQPTQPNALRIDRAFNPNELVAIAERVIHLVLAVPFPRPVFVGCGLLRVELDRLAEIGDCLVVLFLALPDPASAVIGERTRGIKLYGLVIVAERQVDLAFVPAHQAPHRKRERILGIRADSLAIEPDRFLDQDHLTRLDPTLPWRIGGDDIQPTSLGFHYAVGRRIVRQHRRF